MPTSKCPKEEEWCKSGNRLSCSWLGVGPVHSGSADTAHDRRITLEELFPRRCKTSGVTPQGADPRYSLANERTFLAWIRTSLGLLAAAAALVAIDVPWPPGAVRGIAALLASTAALSAFFAWDRWRKVEAAVAQGLPAPPPRVHVILSLTVAVVAGVTVVLILT